ncbi:P-loop containing nucleoside triphosphate hydrolase protein [Yarrowia lipolytica]|uniref:Kinesin-like protein n=1 Tax=Yarrowia lipolytica TaxID=4952 RepID=A0A371CF63_YARLL|nr:P-loop containing nucleoside triphosphate hydrolase protein [Yarrowia lipolytica]RDW34662.1 P-loop containing nucleoside triphosphate hydrolase protein [Yarrowia lipolytica]
MRKSYRPSMSSTRPKTRSSMAPSTGMKVLVRCRGRNERETTENSSVVVKTSGHKGREITIEGGPVAHTGKTYTFDRVFGPESDQGMIFEAVSSSLDEMLQGYNCTIFAYGQTGTGKTYTMTGDFNLDERGEAVSNAGIVPRALVELFKRLSGSAGENSVKLSYVELYNEELRDLLSSQGDTKKLRIFEEPGKKGTVVQGLEEAYVRSCTEAMKVLQEGFTRRQVAATKCNDMSSRSHSVLTITLSTKEYTADGQEYLRTGKLNLVDLAGSENVGRSGAENMRAREAGSINQSLLTLGRVINSLVDGTLHIPYRESKLTRLLQESLGGRTKTVIIATVSPARVSIDETISTLEYSHRAKNIKNSPVVNETTSKQVFIKDYVDEIARLRADLESTRKGQGVFLSQESYQLLLDENESHKVTINEQKMRLDVLEERAGNYEGKIKDMEEQQAVVIKGAKSLLKVMDSAVAEVTKLHEHTRLMGEIGVRNETGLRSLQQSAPKRLKLCVGTHKNDVTHYVTKTSEGLTALDGLQERNNQFFGDLTQRLDSSITSIQAQIVHLISSNNQDAHSMASLLSELGAVKHEMKTNIQASMAHIQTSLQDVTSDLEKHIESYETQLTNSLSQLSSNLSQSVASVRQTYERVQQQIDQAVTSHLNTTSTSTKSIHTSFESMSATVARQKEAQAAAEAELKQRMNQMIESALKEQNDQWDAVVGALKTEVHRELSAVNGSIETFKGAYGESRNQVDFSAVSGTAHQLTEESINLKEATRNVFDRVESGHSSLCRVVDSHSDSVTSVMSPLDSFVVQATETNQNLSEARAKRMDEISSAFEAGLSSTAQTISVYSDTARSDSEAVKSELKTGIESVAHCVKRLASEVDQVSGHIEEHLYEKFPSAPPRSSYVDVATDFRAVVEKGNLKGHTRDPLHEVTNEM